MFIKKNLRKYSSLVEKYFFTLKGAHQYLNFEIARCDWIIPASFVQKMYCKFEKNHLITNNK